MATSVNIMTRADRMPVAVREHDWAATPLGPMAAWPQSLRTATGMMLASGHGMCLAWGPERTLVYNDAYAPMLGERHPDALGMPMREAWPDIWAEIEPLVERAMAGETVTFRDMPLVMTRNGYPEDTWWTFSYSPVHDEGGQVAGFLNVTVETTAWVVAERQRVAAIARLRENEERLRALVNASSDVVYSMSADWMEMKRLDGRNFLTDTDTPSIRWIDEYLLAEDQPSIQSIIDEAIARKGVFELEHRVRAADGSIGWIFSRAVPVLDEHDEITEWFGMAADVTARHVAAAALRESEEFTRSVLASSTDCIKVLRLDGGLEFMSEAGQQLMEISDFNAVRGCPWPDLLGAEGAPQAQDAIAAARLGHTSHFECAANTAAGTPKWWSVSVSPVRDATGKVARILSVSRDHTELREARDQQQLLNGELSHRLKNTLSVIQAIAFQTLSGTADPDALNAFGERISALSRAHDVLLRQSWSAASLGQVAEKVLATFDGGGRISISGPETVIGPRATLALSLLLHELATNAIKHGALSVPEGHVVVTWSRDGDGADAGLTLRWEERGGPPAVEPSRKGFGSRIIRMGLSGSGGTTLRYEPTGLIAEMKATATQLKQA